MNQLNKWQQELENLSRRSEFETNKKLHKYYQEALREIKKEVKQYIDQYDELSFSKKMEAERLMEVGKQMDSILSKTYSKANQSIASHSKGEAERGYYGNWYALEGAGNIQLDMTMLPERYIEQLVNRPVKGKVFSERLYGQRNKLAKNVTSALNHAAVHGQGYAVAAKRIGELTEASYKQAFRIARTEGGRVQSTAKQRSYVEAKKKGVDLKKKWMSALDGVTRDTHRSLDGQVVEVDEEFESSSGAKAEGPRLFGVAEEDIHCRCTTVPEVEGISSDLRKDNETGEIIKYKDYDEWYNDRVANETGTTPESDVQNRLSFLKREMTKFENDDWGNLTEEEVEALYDKYDTEYNILKEQVAEFDTGTEFEGASGDIDKFFNDQKAYKSWKEKLSDEDLTLIEDYTRADYRSYNLIMREGDEAYLNNNLYKGTPLEYRQNQIKRAKLLGKTISNYEAESSFVTYRSVGGYFDTENWENMVPDVFSDVFDKGYMSTTLDKTITNDFAGTNNTILYEIHVKKGDNIGAYVGEISSHKVEKEFLIKPNTKFRVIGKSSEVNANGGLIQKLELEVNHDG